MPRFAKSITDCYSSVSLLPGQVKKAPICLLFRTAQNHERSSTLTYEALSSPSSVEISMWPTSTSDTPRSPMYSIYVQRTYPMSLDTNYLTSVESRFLPYGHCFLQLGCNNTGESFHKSLLNIVVAWVWKLRHY